MIMKSWVCLWCTHIWSEEVDNNEPNFQMICRCLTSSQLVWLLAHLPWCSTWLRLPQERRSSLSCLPLKRFSATDSPQRSTTSWPLWLDQTLPWRQSRQRSLLLLLLPPQRLPLLVSQLCLKKQKKAKLKKKLQTSAEVRLSEYDCFIKLLTSVKSYGDWTQLPRYI